MPFGLPIHLWEMISTSFIVSANVRTEFLKPYWIDLESMPFKPTLRPAPEPNILFRIHTREVYLSVSARLSP